MRSFLFIPPYSPDLNPIELAFSKLKALLRAKAIRTIDALWNALEDYATASVPASAPTTSATTAISSHHETALARRCHACWWAETAVLANVRACYRHGARPADADPRQLLGTRQTRR